MILKGKKTVAKRLYMTPSTLRNTEVKPRWLAVCLHYLPRLTLLFPFLLTPRRSPFLVPLETLPAFHADLSRQLNA